MRERTRERARTRAIGTGSEIILQRYNAILILIFPHTPQHYAHSTRYVFPDSRAVYTIDVPPLQFLFLRKLEEIPPEEAHYRPVGAPLVVFDFVKRILGNWRFTGEVVMPKPAMPSTYPSDATPSLSYPVPATAGGADIFIPTTQPRRIAETAFPIRRVTILADPNNTANIWTGYSPTIQKFRAFPLAPGAARDYDIDDLSKIYLVAENMTDRVYFIYER